jgi:hypothetical protein
MRFGVLGNAKIARTQAIPAILEAGYSVTTIGSRGPANPWPGEPAMQWTSYEGVIADDAVDAVYIALPNHLHAHWSVAALRAGKHVLCEKPYALTTEEAAAIRDAMTTSGRCFMEGFMVRHHPQWQWLATQPLGDVRQVQVVFNYDNQNPDNIRNRPDMGGGALWDIGCYACLLATGYWGVRPIPAVCMSNDTPSGGWIFTAKAGFGGLQRQTRPAHACNLRCRCKRLKASRCMWLAPPVGRTCTRLLILSMATLVTRCGQRLHGRPTAASITKPRHTTLNPATPTPAWSPILSTLLSTLPPRGSETAKPFSTRCCACSKALITVRSPELQ